MHIYDAHPINEGHVLKILAFPRYLILPFTHQADTEVQMPSNKSCLRFWSFQNPIPQMFTCILRVVVFVISEIQSEVTFQFCRSEA